MLYVASPDYSQLRTNYLKAKDAYSLAQKNYVRSQDLYQHHAIAVKDLEQAESAEVQAGGDVASAEAALKVMGVTDPDAVEKGPSSYEVPVRAPIGGEVVEQLVSAGQLLQPGNTQCFTISDMSTVWVLVNVYQKDLPYVRVGDQVTIQTDAYPDIFRGRISYVAAALDPNTRTLHGPYRHRESRRKAEKGHVRDCDRAGGKDSERHRGAGFRGSAGQRKSAFRLCRGVCQSVWKTLGHAWGKPAGADADYRGVATRRPGDWRWQPVSAVRQLTAALTMNEKPAIETSDRTKKCGMIPRCSTR